MKTETEKTMTKDQQAEAITLLRLIDAEWRSDPMSVQCFDLRLVKRVRELLAMRPDAEEKQPK